MVQLIPGHIEGDTYRLPTEAEWEFVVRGRGKLNDEFHFGNDVTLLENYAWYNKNSNEKTHPVAEKNPLIIDGMHFYDMHGNVSEWTQDAFDILPGGIDPLVIGQSDSFRVVRGGSWFNMVSLRSSYREKRFPDFPIFVLGFRLAKDVK